MTNMTDESFKSWLTAAAISASAMSPSSGIGSETGGKEDKDKDPAAQVDSSKTSGSIKGNYASGFLDYVRRVENESKTGWNGSVWHPHASEEGGTPTLAYGHKMTKKEVETGILINGTKWKQGITEKQAEDLLRYDLDRKWDSAARLISSRHGVRMQDLSIARQEMLLDMHFNPGLSVFPRFTRAVLDGNWDPSDPESAYNHYKRHLRGRELGRNKHFYERYFASGVLDGDTVSYLE